MHEDQPRDLTVVQSLSVDWQWWPQWGTATPKSPGNSGGKPAPHLCGATHGLNHCKTGKVACFYSWNKQTLPSNDAENSENVIINKGAQQSQNNTRNSQQFWAINPLIAWEETFHAPRAAHTFMTWWLEEWSKAPWLYLLDMSGAGHSCHKLTEINLMIKAPRLHKSTLLICYWLKHALKRNPHSSNHHASGSWYRE